MLQRFNAGEESVPEIFRREAESDGFKAFFLWLSLFWSRESFRNIKLADVLAKIVLFHW